MKRNIPGRTGGGAATALTALALAAVTAAFPRNAAADEIYLCDGQAVSHIVVGSNAPPRAAQADPCVKAWNVMRRREDARRLAASTAAGTGRGVTSRDFCRPDEPCHKPLPAWTRRWNAGDTTVRVLYLGFYLD